MSDEEHKEDKDEEVEEVAMNEGVEEEEVVMDKKPEEADEEDSSTTEKTLVVEDATRPLPVSIYLNPRDACGVLHILLAHLSWYSLRRPTETLCIVNNEAMGIRPIHSQ